MTITWRQRWNRFKRWVQCKLPWTNPPVIILDNNPVSIISYIEDFTSKYGCDPFDDSNPNAWWE